MKRTISGDLTIYLIIIIVVAELIFGSLQYIVSTNKAKKQLYIKAEKDIDNITSVLTLPLWNMENETIEKIVQSYLHIEEIVRIDISNATRISFEKNYEDGKNIFTRKKEIYYNGIKIGTITIYFTKQGIIQKQNKIISSIILTILTIIFLLIICIHFLLQFFLKKQINILIGGIEEIALGNYNLELPLFKQSDIDTIAKKVNFMAKEISIKDKILIESRNRLQIIKDSTPDAMFVFNYNGKIIEANRTASKIFGYNEPNFLNISIDILCAKECKNKISLEKIQSVKEKTISYECMLKRKNQEEFPGIVRLKKIAIYNQDLILAVITDISRLKTAEETIRRIEDQVFWTKKLATIGELTGGITHDFNNILTIIKGHSEYLLLKIKKDDRYYESISDIYKASESGIGLIQQLLMFSRKEHITENDLNINEIIKRNFGMLRHIVGKLIDVKLELSGDLKQIKGTEGNIEQIIVNIVVNARDAINGQGKIIIATKNAKRNNLDYVVTSISDTGSGISKGTQKKIFEPFFTTKEKGKGTGLGLSIINSIVQRHNGFIEIESNLGKGTTFSIFLPAL
jgi:PAS domain S-box-containing protein